MFARLSARLIRHPRRVIGIWALIFVASVVFGGQVVGKLRTDAEGKQGTEAGIVLDRLEAMGQNAPDVVGLVDGRAVADPATRALVDTTTARLRGLAGVTAVFSGYDSPLFVCRSISRRSASGSPSPSCSTPPSCARCWCRPR